MKKIEDIALEILIKDYNELKSAYRVAEKHEISATAVKRVLKNAGVLRTQSNAAKERDFNHLGLKRSEETKIKLSENAKKRVGEKNPFFGKKHKPETIKKFSENAKARTEKRNPNYKHGQNERRPRDYKTHEFRPIRNFVFNRDDYTCKYCECIGGHLHAHHIIPYWVNNEAFLDPDNLITVCTDCHFKNAHKSNWNKFDTNLVTNKILKKYKLDRERLNELAGEEPEAIVRPPDIKK